MSNPMMTMMLNMLRNKNPQAFNAINQAMRSGGDPMGMVRQMMSQSSPEQIQNVMQQAQQMGIPTDVLNTIQNNK